MFENAMEPHVRVMVRLVRAGQKAYQRKEPFLGIFAFVFLVSVMVLGGLDLLPDPVAATTATAEAAAPAAVSVAVPEEPVKIVIIKIGLSATVENPSSTAISVLDEALLKGAVRYPTSAKLGEVGNVVIFGHSSYLPVVRNQAYKTFDGIQKLAVGDVITVYSPTHAYTYAVESVSKENTGSGAIPLAIEGKKLTLATCDSFGTPSDRFVVVATFVESHTVSS